MKRVKNEPGTLRQGWPIPQKNASDFLPIASRSPFAASVPQHGLLHARRRCSAATHHGTRRVRRGSVQHCQSVRWSLKPARLADLAPAKRWKRRTERPRRLRPLPTQALVRALPLRVRMRRHWGLELLTAHAIRTCRGPTRRSQCI